MCNFTTTCVVKGRPRCSRGSFWGGITSSTEIEIRHSYDARVVHYRGFKNIAMAAAAMTAPAAAL